MIKLFKIFLICIILSNSNFCYCETNTTNNQDVPNNKGIIINVDLIIGAIIASGAFVFQSIIQHYINIREEKIRQKHEITKIEINIRREIKDFYTSLYGYISILTELINALFRAKNNEGKTKIICEDGFKELTIKQLYDAFKYAYDQFAK